MNSKNKNRELIKKQETVCISILSLAYHNKF